MIGSHNSLSYLPIRGWRKILSPWAKCQSLTLMKQYDKGVRYFDFRVKPIGASWHFVHNNTDFGEVNKLLYEVLPVTRKASVHIRFILDVRKKPIYAEEYKRSFRRLINSMNCAYDMNIDSAIVYWEWKDYSKREIEQHEFHTSVLSPWYKYLLGTKWFAKKYNQSYIDQYASQVISDGSVVMLDYVQY